MSDMNLFAQLFAPLRESLTDDELRELAAGLRRAGITYNEILRDTFVGLFDSRIDELTGDRTPPCGSTETSRASGHEPADVAIVPSPPPTNPSSSEPDDKTPVNTELKPSCGNAMVEDIATCNDQKSATYRIGELNPGGFFVSEAAALIHAAGLSKGKLKTVRSNIYTVAARDGRWDKMGPGQFRLLPNVRPIDAGNIDQLRQETADDDGEENEFVQVA